MSKALVAEPETELSESKTALGTIVRRIQKSIDSSLANLMAVGTDLNAIKDGQLYAKGWTSFKEFVEAKFGKFFTYAQADRLMREAVIYNAIKQAIPEGSEIPLPSSENQLRPFFRLKPSVAGQKYVEFGSLSAITGQPITGETIADFLRHGNIESPSSAPKWVAPEVEAQVITDDSDIDFSTEPITTKFRTVAATQTLEKIETLSAKGVFIDNIRQQIEDEVVLISDDELESWGLKSDEEFVKIGLLIFNTRSAAFNFDAKGGLSYSQAIRIIEKPLNERTPLLELVQLTIAKGQKASNVKFRGWTVSAKEDPIT